MKKNISKMNKEKMENEEQMIAVKKEREEKDNQIRAEQAKIASLEMRLASYEAKLSQAVSKAQSDNFELDSFMELTSALQAQISIV